MKTEIAGSDMLAIVTYEAYKNEAHDVIISASCPGESNNRIGELVM
jgi:hypothetical protein